MINNYKDKYLKYKKKYLDLKNKIINEDSPLKDIIINFYNNSFFKIIKKNYCEATKEDVDFFNTNLIRDGSQDNLKDLIRIDTNINLNKTFLELIEPYIEDLNFVCKITKDHNIEENTNIKKIDKIEEGEGLYGQTKGVKDNFEESLKNEKKDNNVPNLFS